jgi:hypothetical protein
MTKEILIKYWNVHHLGFVWISFLGSFFSVLWVWWRGSSYIFMSGRNSADWLIVAARVYFHSTQKNKNVFAWNWYKFADVKQILLLIWVVGFVGKWRVAIFGWMVKRTRRNPQKIWIKTRSGTTCRPNKLKIYPFSTSQTTRFLGASLEEALQIHLELWAAKVSDINRPVHIKTKQTQK